MKNFKKLLVVLTFVLLLSGCSALAKEESTVFENKNVAPGISSTITYYHKADKVTKQSSISVINYEKSGIKNKENAKKALEEAGINQYDNVKGIKHSIEYKDSELIEELIIDFDNLDYEKAKTIPGITLSGDPKNGVSFKASENLAEQQGYTKK